MGEIYIIYKAIITTCGLIGSKHFSTIASLVEPEKTNIIV
jgi:hypothetical protein